MNVLEVIKEEHSKIEKELQELEIIINSEPVNYAGLIHIFSELNDVEVSDKLTLRTQENLPDSLFRRNPRDFSASKSPKICQGLFDFWNKHEEKEEIVFDVLRGNGFKIPTKEISFEHGELRKLREEILDAVNSGKEDRMIGVLRTKGVKMIEKVRSHMEKEDWMLLSTPWEQVEFLFPENARFMIKFRENTEKMKEDFDSLG